MNSLIACHDCDLLQRLPPMAMGIVAECPRCGATLRRTQFNSVNRTIAWLSAALILYIVAVSFPFLSIDSRGISHETGMATGMIVLFEQGMEGMGMVVLLTCLIIPLLTILSQLYVLLPITFGYSLPFAAQLFAWTQRLRPWGMLEIYLLGILVSMVKLAKMARIIPGPSLFSFIALIFVLAASSVSLDAHLVWDFFQTTEEDSGHSFPDEVFSKSQLEGNNLDSHP